MAKTGVPSGVLPIVSPHNLVEDSTRATVENAGPGSQRPSKDLRFQIPPPMQVPDQQLSSLAGDDDGVGEGERR